MVIARYFKSLFSVLFTTLIVSVSPALAQDGPLNLGFEDGDANWNIIQEAEFVGVVGAEGPSVSSSYEDLNLTIEPFNGNKMLRLGTPKKKNEKMQTGLNRVSQTFISTNESIVISVRMFGWEHREQRDTFSVDVKKTGSDTETFPVKSFIDGTFTENFTVGLYNYETDTYGQNCLATPCTFWITSGDRGEFLDTKWQRLIISGLPTDGSEVTISYTLAGNNDKGHPVWAYVDHGNTKPVADYIASVESTVEGSVSRYINKSKDPDIGDSIKSTIWEITYENGDSGDSRTETHENLNEVTIIAANEGTVTAKLTVFDIFGDSDTIQVGDVRPDGTPVKPITYIDGPIMVNNLTTYNVVAGSKNILTARFADPGWEDTVTTAWSLTSGVGELLESEKHDAAYYAPMMLKGLTAIPFVAPEDAGGTTSIVTLTLSNPNGDGLSKTININIQPKNIFNVTLDEAGDTANTASSIKSGTVNLGYINTEGDVDLYKITDENGNNFPVGSEIFVKLTNHASDNDLFVINKLPTEAASNYTEFITAIGNTEGLFGSGGYNFSSLFGSGGYNFSSLFGSGGYNFSSLFGSGGYNFSSLFGSGGYNFSSLDDESGFGVGSIAFTSIPDTDDFSWNNAAANGKLHSMWLRDSELKPFADTSIANGFGFQHLPLSEAIYRPTSSQNITSKDLDLAQTAIGKIASNGYYISSFSANDGYSDETMLIKVVAPGDIILGVASDDIFGVPYNLQVEHSTPTNLAHITDGACNGTQRVSTSENSSGILADADFGNTVMYVVNPLRLNAKYGESTWSNSIYPELKQLAESESGKILVINTPVENGVDLYAAMDSNPCDVTKANDVALKIRGTIKGNRGAAEHVVLIGGDDMIPSYRVMDMTLLTERDYVATTPIPVSSPMYSALFYSNILTDKVYASGYGIEQMPVKLLLQEWSVSRVVETAEDIVLSIRERLNNNNGQIIAQTALVSAYDTVVDSGKSIASTLTNNGLDVITVPGDLDNFSSNPLWQAVQIQCYLLNEGGGEGSDCRASDIVSLNGHFSHNTLISQAGYKLGTGDTLTTRDIDSSTSNISGNYIYTPGCHAGLNVTAPWGNADAKGFDDFPQSYLRKGATYLAGTGYGIAGVDTNAFSERLMDLQTKLMVQGGNLGDIVKNADTFYMLSALHEGLNPYDIKSIYQNTLYGFSNTMISEAPAPSFNDISGCTSESSSTFELTVIDGADPITKDPVSLDKKCTDSGEYYVSNAGNLAVLGRPLQPRSVVSNTSNSADGDIRAVILEAATFTEETLNPVIMTASTDNSANPVEQAFCEGSRYWPSGVIDYSDNGTETVFKIVSGQFVCENETINTGQQRLYNTATVRVFRSLSDDVIPPVINTIEPATNDAGNVVYYVDASDECAISQILLTVDEGGSVTTLAFDNPELTNDGRYKITLSPEQSNLVSDNNVTVTIVDCANNIAVDTRKGRGLKQVTVELDDSVPTVAGPETTLSATIHNFVSRKNAGLDSMSYIWDFGDRQIDAGSVFNGENVNANFVINEQNDTAIFTTTHSYTASGNCGAHVKFKVTDSSGGIGTDEMILDGDASESIPYLADFPQLANSDMSGCSVESDGTTLTFRINLLGQVSTDVQYRLHVDFNNDGDVDLKSIYDNGKFTGSSAVSDLNVVEGDHYIEYSFDSAGTGWVAGMPLNWYMQTQSGVPNAPQIGQADSMPDSGTFTYTGQ